LTPYTHVSFDPTFLFNLYSHRSYAYGSYLDTLSPIPLIRLKVLRKDMPFESSLPYLWKGLISGYQVCGVPDTFATMSLGALFPRPRWQPGPPFVSYGPCFFCLFSTQEACFSPLKPRRGHSLVNKILFLFSPSLLLKQGPPQPVEGKEF